MLFAASGVIGCPVKGSDDAVGRVKDFLFDDRSWKVRWMVVDTGDWLPGRQTLIHPSAIEPLVLPPKPALPMVSMAEKLTVSVRLTRRQIEASPSAGEDEPVTRQLETRLYDHYGWDPVWGGSTFGGEAVVMRPSGRPVPAEVAEGQAQDLDAPPGDPHLGSAGDIKGFAVHATDGDLGPVENVLADDVAWDIRYLVVATHHWLPGKFVQLSPHAVTDIDWPERRVNVNVTRERVKSAPAWNPLAMMDKTAEDQLHRHYGWPGYGP